MATNTYVALDKVTVGTATGTITFTSIPQTYTDLVIVSQIKTVSGTTNLRIRFNGDTTTNYSVTNLSGNGSSAFSSRIANINGGYIDNYGQPTTTFSYSNTIQVFNYTNTTTFKTVLSRANNADIGVDAAVNLWRKTPEAITSVTLYSNNASTFDTGSTFSLYGIASTTAQGAKAEGGMITSDDLYWYHTFTASGTFRPLQSLSCDYLVVAGGAGGGVSGAGGGGGAGGYRTGILSLTTGNKTVTVGAGGAGAASEVDGSNGSNSVFDSITSTGGGGGGTNNTGVAGGSGGGGGISGGLSPNSGGAASPSGQGSAGGTSSGSGSGSTRVYLGAGGGGASAVGATGSGSNAGAGGAGTTTLISGSSVTYAGGGGGGGGRETGAGSVLGGAGGTGGGGTGSSTGINAIAGTVNTGSGGGGGNFTGAGFRAGAAGGSGVVIVRYLKA
jgi:hypothetical protein